MIVVGITGGIGSGKTVVCKIFSNLGIPVYDADTAAKDLYDIHPDLAAKIRTDISEDAVDKNGKVNRKILSEIIFNDTVKLQLLNKMVHPLVKSDFDAWKKKQAGHPYVIKEAAILFESGTDKGCDKIITVVAPAELRIGRIRERDRRSKQEIEQIMIRQMNDEEKMSKSDYVIVNDEKQMVLPQVLKIHNELQLIAEPAKINEDKSDSK
jgi:dephospho-CoA kinase